MTYDLMIEIFGALTGMIYVVLEVKQNKWLWPLGIVTALVYIYVYYTGKFYADMGLQFYFVFISIYGWHYWQKEKGTQKDKKELSVSHIKVRQAIVLFVLFMVLWLGMYFVLITFTDSPLPIGDSFTTALSLIATWMLTQKIIEQWFLWIVINMVSIGLYIYKGLYPTTVLFVVYTLMAFYGYYVWKKSMHKQSNELVKISVNK